jgi:adenine deaminase
MSLIQNRIAAYDELRLAARGEITADLLLHGGKILNVLTGEILPGNVLIHKGFIAALFTKGGDARQKIDIRGMIAAPAFIDPHVHIESSMVLPPQYAEVVAVHGTGTILADPHEIVNVMGVDGFALMAENSNGLPVRFFWDIPTCVPSKRKVESSGADIRAAEVREMHRRGGRKLGELMSYEEIAAGEAIMTEIVKTGWELGVPRDAHFPMLELLGGVFNALSPLQKVGVFAGMIGAQVLRVPALSALPFQIIARQLRTSSYPDLNAYLVALGLTADHETYGPEMQVKLDHGMRLILSSHIFTFSPMLPLLLQGVKRLRYKDAVGLCTDDMWPDDLLEKGGLAGVIRALIRHGISPVDAIRFATLNNAQRLAQAGIAEATLIGSLSPGMAADIALIAEPLGELRVEMVLHEGKVVAEHGRIIQSLPLPIIPPAALNTVQVPQIEVDSFRIPVPANASNGRVRTRVLTMPKPPALPFPEMIEEDIPLQDGYLDTSGYAVIAVFNRYGRCGDRPVLGLIKGYSLKAGAVASTLAHDSHNLIVLGTNPADMAMAARHIVSTKGGMAAVRNGQVLASLSFPVGGLMSDGSVVEIAHKAREFRQAIGSLELDPTNPILPFAIFSLPAAPGAKVTDLGIWDSRHKQMVSLFV